MQSLKQGFIAWIAIFAMMMGALAPTISRAMGPGADGRYLIEVCSADGSGWVAVDAAQFVLNAGQTPLEGSGEDNLSSFKHCPFCCLHASLALPSAAATPDFGDHSTRVFAPRFFLDAPWTLFAWSPSHARAPPARA